MQVTCPTTGLWVVPNHPVHPPGLVINVLCARCPAAQRLRLHAHCPLAMWLTVLALHPARSKPSWVMPQLLTNTISAQQRLILPGFSGLSDDSR